MILLIDNYDSFVFNLERYLRELGMETLTVRNDRLTVEEIRQLGPRAIVISPGPCTPREAGVSLKVVSTLGSTIPILGVCLGHQAIAMACGGKVVRAPEAIHGRSSLVTHDQTRLFQGLPNPLKVGRYHSLIAEERSLPTDLRVTARTDDGLLMAFEHRRFPMFGVQFHPESVLTHCGHLLLANFLKLVGLPAADPPSPEYIAPVVDEDFYTQPIAADALPRWPMSGR